MSLYIKLPSKKTKSSKWRAELNGKYYIINSILGIEIAHDFRTVYDNNFYNCGNYFKTKKEAQEMLEKIKKVLIPD